MSDETAVNAAATITEEALERVTDVLRRYRHSRMSDYGVAALALDAATATSPFRVVAPDLST